MDRYPPNTRTDERIVFYVMQNQLMKADILVAIAEQLEEAFYSSPPY